MPKKPNRSTVDILNVILNEFTHIDYNGPHALYCRRYVWTLCGFITYIYHKDVLRNAEHHIAQTFINSNPRGKLGQSWWATSKDGITPYETFKPRIQYLKGLIEIASKSDSKTNEDS